MVADRLTPNKRFDGFCVGFHAGPTGPHNREDALPRRFDTIQTKRLQMRRWRGDDRAPFAALNADAETMRYFPGTLDWAASDAMVDVIESRFEQHGYGLWALEIAFPEMSDGRFSVSIIGTI